MPKRGETHLYSTKKCLVLMYDWYKMGESGLL